jgi:Peptidase A4 family
MQKNEHRLAETNVPGHFTFEPPPEGFSPARVSDAELRRHGLPHRPEPHKFPKQARLWLRSMARINTFITPQLTLRPEITHGPTHAQDALDFPLDAGVFHNNTVNNWSGLVANSAFQYTQAWGSWTIPEVTVPSGGAGAYYSSMWVGLIDGQSLFQAGTETDTPLINFSGEQDICYPWYEWFPGPSVQIGLGVTPGQAVGVNVEPLNDGSGRGVVSMINYTTGIAITPIVVPPPTQGLNGTPINPPIRNVPSLQSQWILERPAFRVNGVQVLQALADFGIAGFLFGGAVDIDSTNGQKAAFDLVTVGENDQGTLLNMIANDNVTVLSQAQERPGLVFFFTGGALA